MVGNKRDGLGEHSWGESCELKRLTEQLLQKTVDYIPSLPSDFTLGGCNEMDWIYQTVSIVVCGSKNK